MGMIQYTLVSHHSNRNRLASPSAKVELAAQRGQEICKLADRLGVRSRGRGACRSSARTESGNEGRQDDFGIER
jgi:hypothetical protein